MATLLWQACIMAVVTRRSCHLFLCRIREWDSLCCSFGTGLYVWRWRWSTDVSPFIQSSLNNRSRHTIYPLSCSLKTPLCSPSFVTFFFVTPFFDIWEKCHTITSWGEFSMHSPVLGDINITPIEEEQYSSEIDSKVILLGHEIVKLLWPSTGLV